MLDVVSDSAANQLINFHYHLLTTTFFNSLFLKFKVLHY